jgi:uroporphyrinogen-III synthase
MPDLAGLWVVITRPAPQAVAIGNALEQAGARVIRFPLLRIVPLSADPDAQALIGELDHFQLAVFVSPNAVTHGLAMVSAQRSWPAQLGCAAVGRGTAAALDAAGMKTVIVPRQGADSEALLALPELQQVAGQRIVILRGDGGRELLATALRERGAEVSHLECYRREPEPADAGLLSRHWQAGELDVILITSSESLRLLYRLVQGEDRARLLDTALVVNHPRVAATAAQLGWRAAVGIASDAGDESMLAALARL